MGNSDGDRPDIAPPNPGVAPGSQRRRSPWARLKAWFAKEPGRHDSYVSNVTNPDDRRFIPRR